MDFERKIHPKKKNTVYRFESFANELFIRRFVCYLIWNYWHCYHRKWSRSENNMRI